MVRLVGRDIEDPDEGSDRYNNPGSAVASTLRADDVAVHNIPDFVFSLKKIQVPFSHNFSFDPHLSRFKYERDFT